MLNPAVLISLLICITIHEFFHAFVADRLGDPTARSMGRLSLNPLRHLDPLGTIMMLFVGIGWGKPVPIDPYNLQNPRRDETLIAIAGPFSNLILAIITALIIRLTNIYFPFLITFIIINVSLAIFNLLPIPPLDGSKVFLNLLSVDSALKWEEAFNRYGFILLAALLFLPVGGSNIVSLIITPAINLILSVLV
jgi:Zn-dependent protease